jgi:phospholipase A1
MTGPPEPGAPTRASGVLVLLVGTCMAPAVLAGEAGATTPGAECLAIEDPAARLQCFDAAVGAAVRTDVGGLPGLADQPVATAPESSPEPRSMPSLIDATWGFQPESREAYVRLHEPNYLLVARYSDNVNEAPYRPLFEAFEEEADFRNVEAKFQLSFKGRLLATDDRRWGLWFAYTQQSLWQVYGDDFSRPFRETNYAPEVFGSFRPGLEVLGLQWNLLNFGYTHQSNGRSDPISRSWERLFVEAGLERGDFVLMARAWARFRPGDYEDDNPDIVDYYGHGQLTGYYRHGRNTFSVMARGNVSTGKGAAQFTWATRPVLGPLRGYLQVFTGYGESMIDYDWRQTTVGLGITLNEKF